MNDADKNWLTDHFGSQVAFSEPMSRHTTFGIGGPADALLTVRTDQQLRDLVRWAQDRGLPFMILGAGSNLLVRDGGIRGLVVKLANGFESVRQSSEPLPNGWVGIIAGAGVLVRKLGKYALDNGLGGLNFALGIPGTVGGALRMNAGAWGSSMADTTSSISFLNQHGDIVTMGKEKLRFSYRGLDVEEGSIILRGEFRLERSDLEGLRQEALKMQRKRRSTQPLSLPSAGSIFRNPSADVSAGELIDRAGLKGFRKGGAEVSTRHANFIVNKGDARASDVVALMEHIQDVVFDRFAVSLEPEVIIIGQEAGSQELL
jgi:UDP-N-acetylmuramate dehydrogenase